MLPLSPESSEVHVVEARPEITIEIVQTTSIPPMPVAEGVFYSADNYFSDGDNAHPHYVDEQGKSVEPPEEVLTTDNEFRMMHWILKHRGMILPEDAT